MKLLFVIQHSYFEIIIIFFFQGGNLPNTFPPKIVIQHSFFEIIHYFSFRVVVFPCNFHNKF